GMDCSITKLAVLLNFTLRIRLFPLILCSCLVQSVTVLLPSLTHVI
uniref:Uncharacterized protein n=1 Tax=Aegilops tauschii subsp. strangulata TaxID=200361 RepID=A0A453PQ81_AEGTS